MSGLPLGGPRNENMLLHRVDIVYMDAILMSCRPDSLFNTLCNP